MGRNPDSTASEARGEGPAAGIGPAGRPADPTRDWQHADDDLRSERLQFGLRDLLALMTLCCVGLSVLSYLSFSRVALCVLGYLAWCGLLVGQGASARAATAGCRSRSWDDPPGLRRRRRWAVFLAVLGALGPTVTFLVFVAVFWCAGPDFNRLGEIGSYVDQLTGSGELGSGGAWSGTWLALLSLNPASAVLYLVSCAFSCRARQDLPLLATQVFGLVNSLVATAVTLACYLSV